MFLKFNDTSLSSYFSSNVCSKTFWSNGLMDVYQEQFKELGKQYKMNQKLLFVIYHDK
jgi:hypothetical protein